MTALIVNLDEFAELCGITAETMRVHIRAVEGEPAWLVRKGDRGRGYEIDAAGGVAWWQERCDAEVNASAERRAQLSQMRLELVGPGVVDQQQLGMPGRARREEIEAGFRELEFRKAKRELVVRSELDHVLTGASAELRRRLQLCPGEFAIVSGLAPEVVRPLEGILARAMDAFVASLGPFVAPENSKETENG